MSIKKKSMENIFIRNFNVSFSSQNLRQIQLSYFQVFAHKTKVSKFSNNFLRWYWSWITVVSIHSHDSSLSVRNVLIAVEFLHLRESSHTNMPAQQCLLFFLPTKTRAMPAAMLENEYHQGISSASFPNPPFTSGTSDGMFAKRQQRQDEIFIRRMDSRPVSARQRARPSSCSSRGIAPEQIIARTLPAFWILSRTIGHRNAFRRVRPSASSASKWQQHSSLLGQTRRFLRGTR